jgi:hypothetical protein
VSTDATASSGTTVPPPPPADAALGDPGQPHWAGYTRFAVVAAIAGLALFIGVGGINMTSASGEEAEAAAKTRFASAYLTGYTFWFSLPIGALALLLIHHLVKTSWGLLLRSYLEAASRTLPLIIGLWVILVILASGKTTSPYWWTHPEDTYLEPAPESGEVLSAGNPDKHTQAVQGYEAQRRKAIEFERKDRAEGNFGFLSMPAFIGVGIVLFAIWGTMIYLLNKWGREAQAASGREAVEAVLAKPNAIGGPGLIIYAITITAAASQWVMSIEPSWSSTMFPVIFAVNQFLTCFAFCLALFLLMVSRSPLKEVMRPKFQIDMGTLLLAFTMFWSYTSFSQFMLVWVANLPEEIPFFLRRSDGGWFAVSAILCVFHFALPFLLLLFRDIKMHPVRLRWVAVYLVAICAIDVTWWIAPSFPQMNSFPTWLMDVGAILGIGGAWGLYFIWQLKQRPLLPTSALYRLPEGHHHEQH